MKTSQLLQKGMIAAAVLLGITGFTSCLNDDDNYSYYQYLPNALVTAKIDTDETFFLQLDDSTTLLPVNIAKSPFGDKEVRALTSIEEVNEPGGKYTKTVQVHWIDSILTKKIAPDLGEEKNDSVYGNDPIDILKDWVTIAEDGYLTLRFATYWSNTGQPHFVNLLSTHNPENPYELEFRHNAYGDLYGEYAPGLVAFSLDQLPDTDGKTVKLTLKWNSFNGEKSVDFDYCSQKAVNPNSQVIANGFNKSTQAKYK